MASRAVRVIRPIAVIGALMASLVLVGAPAVATPDSTPTTTPTISSVRAKLDTLARKNSQIVDKYDAARVLLDQRTAAAAKAARQSTLAQQHYTASRQNLVRVMQAQYMGSGLGAAGALLDSNSSVNYIDRLDVMNLVSIQTTEVVKTATSARKSASAAATAASHALDAAKAQRASLGKQRTAVEKQISQYKDLLATLTAEQQAAYQRAQEARDAEAAALAANANTNTNTTPAPPTAPTRPPRATTRRRTPTATRWRTSRSPARRRPRPRSRSGSRSHRSASRTYSPPTVRVPTTAQA